MSKALTVLAECVDARSGKRFLPGDVFDPAPTAEQAQRLVRAGCLPADSVDAARKAEADAEKKTVATKEAKAKAAVFEKAKAKADAARVAVANAETALDAAADAEKAASQKALDDARTAQAEADAELAELSK
jgi:colicin import membrane protein